MGGLRDWSALVRPEIDTALGLLYIRIHQSLRYIQETEKEACNARQEACNARQEASGLESI
jgi:hypothetical protein